MDNIARYIIYALIVSSYKQPACIHTFKKLILKLAHSPGVRVQSFNCGKTIGVLAMCDRVQGTRTGIPPTHTHNIICTLCIYDHYLFEFSCARARSIVDWSTRTHIHACMCEVHEFIVATLHHKLNFLYNVCTCTWHVVNDGFKAMSSRNYRQNLHINVEAPWQAWLSVINTLAWQEHTNDWMSFAALHPSSGWVCVCHSYSFVWA